MKPSAADHTATDRADFSSTRSISPSFLLLKRKIEMIGMLTIMNIFRYCSGTIRFSFAPRNEPSIENGRVISADLRWMLPLLT